MNSLVCYNNHLTSESNNVDYSVLRYPSSVDNTTKDVKAVALRLLARREYSRLELYRKLSQKFSDTSVIQSVLNTLSDEGYQSDARFSESFIRSKVSLGSGPLKIKIALREKGVCESTILSAFDHLSVNWLGVISRVFVRRFGDFEDQHSGMNDSEKQQSIAKQIRYLKGKGFYQEHIETVVCP